jgi:uncharacterized protein YkwD
VPIQIAAERKSRAKRGTIAKALVVLVALLCSSLCVGGTRASAAETPQQHMFRLVNELRMSKGLSTLAFDPALQTVASGWSETMSKSDDIFHNMNLMNDIKTNWTKIGENVGMGGDLDDIQDKFIASPKHYANLVDPVWDHMAIGIFQASDGTYFVTQHFEHLRNPPPFHRPTTTSHPSPQGTHTVPAAMALQVPHPKRSTKRKTTRVKRRTSP